MLFNQQLLRTSRYCFGDIMRVANVTEETEMYYVFVENKLKMTLNN